MTSVVWIMNVMKIVITIHCVTTMRMKVVIKSMTVIAIMKILSDFLNWL